VSTPLSPDRTPSTANGLAAVVDDAPETQPGLLEAMLVRLVRTPSVNPGVPEAAMAAACAGLLGGSGFDLHEVDLAPGRPSLAAVFDTGRPGPRLVFNGHMDTVAVESRDLWEVDPFEGAVRDGEVWGRGAADMKAGLVAQIAAGRLFARLAASPDGGLGTLRGALVLQFAAGEEVGEDGTLSLLQAGLGGDVGICTEPTRLRVATAMRGVAWYRVRLEGTAAHGGSRHMGVNPIDALPEVLHALNAYDERIGQTTHPLLGQAFCTPTRVAAGIQNNSVPAALDLVADRRLLPGETVAGALGEIRDVVSAALAAHPRLGWSVEQSEHGFAPAEVSADSPFVETVRAAAARVVGRREPVTGTPYGSDVRNLILDAGMEAVTFGPGDIDLCHRPNEHVAVAEVSAAARVLAEVALTVCRLQHSG
jgi:succinyl-diaminopimelate desuccinylase